MVEKGLHEHVYLLMFKCIPLHKEQHYGNYETVNTNGWAVYLFLFYASFRVANLISQCVMLSQVIAIIFTAYFFTSNYRYTCILRK